MSLTILYVAVPALSGLKSKPGAAKAAHTAIKTIKVLTGVRGLTI
jgi:hypothetical protein